MSEKKRFHDFFTDSKRKDIFNNLGEFYTFYKNSIDSNEYTYRRPLTSKNSSSVYILDTAGNSKKMIMMASNNYLNLASNESVINAATVALKKYGYGSGSVALLSGTFEVHKLLEKKIACFNNRESAALFPTGYSTNLGVISSLVKEKDLLIMDMYSHASLIDGSKLSKGTVKFFKHNDMEHLEKILIRLRDKFDGVLIVTDGVFSMDGDICDLPKLLELKNRYNARLMIDEAHAIGTIGERGRGTEEYFKKEGQVDIISGTLSKAPAGLGGYVTGNKEMVEFVRHFSNSYVFSTSLPPSVVGGLLQVFNILEQDQTELFKLQNNIKYFTNSLRSIGFDIGKTITAIVPVIVGDELITNKISKELFSLGVFASAVVFPAVRKSQSRIRLSLMSSHTKDELDYVINVLGELGKKFEVIPS